MFVRDFGIKQETVKLEDAEGTARLLPQHQLLS